MLVRARRFLATQLLVLSVMVVAAVPAFAQTATDPLGGKGEAFMSDIKSYVTTYLLPGLFALVLLGITVALIVKWARRGAKAV